MAEQPQVAEGFGDRVRELRVAKGYTQTLLGKIVGVALSAVTDWETGRRLPRDTAVLIRLAGALGCSLDYLLLDVEGEHELVKRRLTELLDEMDLSRHALIRAAQRQTKPAGSESAEADVRPDPGAVRRRGTNRGA